GPEMLVTFAIASNSSPPESARSSRVPKAFIPDIQIPLLLSHHTKTQRHMTQPRVWITQRLRKLKTRHNVPTTRDRQRLMIQHPNHRIRNRGCFCKPSLSRPNMQSGHRLTAKIPVPVIRRLDGLPDDEVRLRRPLGNVVEHTRQQRHKVRVSREPLIQRGLHSTKSRASGHFSSSPTCRLRRSGNALRSASAAGVAYGRAGIRDVPNSTK